MQLFLGFSSLLLLIFVVLIVDKHYNNGTKK